MATYTLALINNHEDGKRFFDTYNIPYQVYITVKMYPCSGGTGFFRIFWYKVWILSLIPDKINIIKMKEGILKCLQILHLIYNDFIQMSLK